MAPLPGCSGVTGYKQGYRLMWRALSKSVTFLDRHGFMSTSRFWVIFMFDVNKQSINTYFQNINYCQIQTINTISKLVKA